MTTAWLDELDLDPSGTWRRMGTRRLAVDEPWLVADAAADRELALKGELLRDHRDDVLVAPDDSRSAAAETLALVEEAIGATGDPGLHPLEAAGRLVQEDLCLLERRENGWVLAAGSVCFPSRWSIGDKVGRSITDVHQPVDGYDEVLADRVNHLFDRLGDSPVRRRNWFIHPDPALFQPHRPLGGDPVIPAAHCPTELYVRSERQTLRRLPRSGWILFTIRIQQTQLADLIDHADGAAKLARYLREAPPEQSAHRGVSEGQRAELELALAR